MNNAIAKRIIVGLLALRNDYEHANMNEGANAVDACIVRVRAICLAEGIVFSTDEFREMIRDAGKYHSEEPPAMFDEDERETLVEPK